MTLGDALERTVALRERAALRERDRAHRDAAVARMAREGENNATISARTGLSVGRVQRLLREMGLRGCR